MIYKELTALPPYERARFEGDKAVPATSGKVRWGADEAPPAIGDAIVVTMNNCGPAIVTGYFVQDGYLGLRCRLTNAPDWHVKQNKGDPNGHVFGPEFMLGGRHDRMLAILAELELEIDDSTQHATIYRGEQPIATAQRCRVLDRESPAWQVCGTDGALIFALKYAPREPARLIKRRLAERMAA